MKKSNHNGYLPDFKPKFGKALIFALQQFLVMIPATVLAALIMNSTLIPNTNEYFEIYSIPAAIFASGFATIGFLIITKGKIPLYYGSSFSYIPAISIITSKYALTFSNLEDNGAKIVFGAIMLASIISGLMSIGAGLLIRRFGKEKIDKILPGHITGMIAMIIGLSLANNTMTSILNITNDKVDWLSVLVASITFVTISILTVILKKGFISQIPILLGIGIGIIFSYLIYVPSLNKDLSYFKSITFYITNLERGKIGLFDHMPWNTIKPALSNPSVVITAILAIFPIAFATIPESAAHVNQVDLYVNNLAKELQIDKQYNIKDLLDLNLIGDGSADIIAVLLSGPAGTNYGENVSASAVTKNFSSYVFKLTGILAIITGLLLHFLGNINISQLLTNPVIQGVSLYLFGAIAVQGIALMIDKKVNIFDSKVVAVMAFIAIVGLGVTEIPINNNFILPGIGVAAFGGIILNLILNTLDNYKSKRA